MDSLILEIIIYTQYTLHSLMSAINAVYIYIIYWYNWYNNNMYIKYIFICIKLLIIIIYPRRRVFYFAKRTVLYVPTIYMCVCVCVSVTRSLVGQHHNTASLSWIPHNNNTAAVDWIGSNCTAYEKNLFKTKKKLYCIYCIYCITINTVELRE